MESQNYNQNPNHQDSKAEDVNSQNVQPENGHSNSQGKQGDAEHPNRKKYVYFVGKQKFETDQAQMSVSEILLKANVNISSKTLAIKQQGGFREFKDPNEVITLDHALHFVLFDNEPNTVS